MGMYAFHFYAGTHMSLMARVREEARLIPIFATEWGTSQANGDGGPYLEDAKNFLDLFNDASGQKISWAQWSYADKSEKSAAQQPGACAAKTWDATSCSGTFLKAYIKMNAPTCSAPTPTPAPRPPTTSPSQSPTTEPDPEPEPEPEPVTPSPTPSPTSERESTPQSQCYLAACGCSPFTGGAAWCGESNAKMGGDWCQSSASNCANCNGVWCSGASVDPLLPTPDSTPSPSPSPTSELEPT